jgi:hypothetical protein
MNELINIAIWVFSIMLGIAILLVWIWMISIVCIGLRSLWKNGLDEGE